MGIDLPFAAGPGRALREALSQGRGSLSSFYRLFIQRAQALEIPALAEPSSALTCGGRQYSPPTERPGLRKHRAPCEHSPSAEPEWRNEQSKPHRVFEEKQDTRSACSCPDKATPSH